MAANANNFGDACECFPDCFDIATGVLMQRHGLLERDAREKLLRSAEQQDTSVHAVAQDIIGGAADRS